MVRKPKSGAAGLVLPLLLLVVLGGGAYAVGTGKIKLPKSATKATASPVASVSPGSAGSLGSENVTTAGQLQATGTSGAIPLGSSASVVPKTQEKTPSSLVATIKDADLREAISGAFVAALADSKNLPNRSDLYNPIELIHESNLDDAHVAVQQNESGYVMNLPSDANSVRVLAPCYTPKTLSVAELKKTPDVTLKRTCKDNSYFGLVADSVSGKGMATTILLTTKLGGAKQLKIDDSGYYTATVPNADGEQFTFVVNQSGYKQAGFQGAIDASAPASNSWVDITLLPDLQGAKVQ